MDWLQWLFGEDDDRTQGSQKTTHSTEAEGQSKAEEEELQLPSIEEWVTLGQQQLQSSLWLLYEAVVQSFEQVVGLEPEQAEGWQEKANFWISQGDRQSRAGNYTAAIASFDEALRYKPDDHEAWYSRGLALGNLERYEEEIISYEEALKYKPDKHEAWYNRGYVLVELGRYEEAIISYDKALDYKPDKHKAWNNRGIALSRLGRYEEAITSYDTALQHKPNDHGAWSSRGIALKKLGRYEEAIISYDTALQHKPDDHEAWSSRGIALDDLGRYEEAIISYDTALQHKPGDDVAWYNRGIALDNLGRYEEAINSYDTALQHKPDKDDAWHNRGVALKELGRYEEAIASFDTALQHKPDKHEAWSSRGIALGNLERYEEAIISYEEALKYKPDYDVAWHNRGFALSHLERYEEAIISYEEALKYKPDYDVAWHNRGFALSHLERYEEAITSYDTALQHKQQDQDKSWYCRGFALSRLGRYEEAIINFDTALSHKPDKDDAWHERGVALKKLRRYEEAITSFDTALSHKPDDSTAWNDRGIALGMLGRYEEAIISFDTALSYEPDGRVAWYNRCITLKDLGRYEEAIIGFDTALSHKPDDHKTWIGRSDALFALGRDEEAINNLEEALKYEPNLVEALSEQIEDYESVFTAYNRILRFCLRRNQTELAWGLAQKGSELLRRLITERRIPGREEQFTLKFSSFNQLTVDSVLSQQNDRLKALDVADRAKNVVLRRFHRNSPSPEFSYSSIQQTLLDSHTAALYWHLSPYALTCFLLTAHHPEPQIPLFTPPQPQLETLPATVRRVHDWEAWVSDWDQQYDDYQETQNPDEQKKHSWQTGMPARLEKLRTLLEIPKLEAELGDITHLILIPHRDLHRFPLHALFHRPFTTTYLPSLQVGINLQAQSPAPITASDRLLSLENPQHQQSDPTGTTKKLLPLPFAEVESDLLCHKFTGPNPRLGDTRATEAAILNTLNSQPDLLHFTGHGAYNFHNPADSCLFLSGSDRLTAATLSQLNLHTLKLVALSACETAVTGNQTITTEYVGLVSAFLQAGAAQVLSTLWTVQSESSALFMVEFYNQLLNGNPAPAALHHTQTWLRTATREDLKTWLDRELNAIAAHPNTSQTQDDLEICRDKLNTLESTPYKHPYHWAAFTLAGLC